MNVRKSCVFIALALVLSTICKTQTQTYPLPGLNPFDPSKMVMQTKLAILKEGTPQQIQAVWATLKGTQQTFPNHTAISGSTSQLLFSVRTSSTQNVGQAVLIPVEVDLNTPLSNMPDPSKQVWFQGILSGMKADGTIVLTTADEVPAPAPHPLSPQQLALIRSRIPPSIPAPGVLDFVYNNDTKAGNCHIHPGNRFEISAGPNGIDLHFTAQMSTDFTISGDIFHLTFEFYDNNGNLILSSPEIDFPQNGAMYMNRGPTNIDYKTTIGPVAQPANLLQQIKSADYSGRC